MNRNGNTRLNILKRRFSGVVKPTTWRLPSCGAFTMSAASLFIISIRSNANFYRSAMVQTLSLEGTFTFLLGRLLRRPGFHNYIWSKLETTQRENLSKSTKILNIRFNVSGAQKILFYQPLVQPVLIWEWCKVRVISKLSQLVIFQFCALIWIYRIEL